MKLASARHRGLLWLRGESAWTREHAQQAFGGADEVLWVGGAVPADITALAMRKAVTRLGHEHDVVVFDAHDGFDPDAFGALAGTVRAGGLLILLSDESFGSGPDGDYYRLADWPHEAAALSARYLARLARLLKASSSIALWRQGDSWPRFPVLAVAPPDDDLGDDACLSPDQAQAVERLVKLKRRRPLVIIADRGRGKSAALGIAAARRMAAGEQELLVTAPRPGAVEPLFERLAALCPNGRRDGNLFRWPQPDGTSRQVRFVAPDALLPEEGPGEGGPGTTLFVDEAAALPAPLLTRWLEAFPRIAFATTVHGYEGTGRGFAVRFRERLDAIAPDWRGIKLEAPIRWAAHDPLEATTRELLCLDAEPASDEHAIEALARGPIHLRRWSRDALAEDEPQLNALFGLLVQAHYRTAPADLRLLLDGPGVNIEVLEAGEILLGVAVTIDEGGFDDALAEAITCGERRPRGHLIAQSLALHGGVIEAAQARLRRVMRIAVHSACRRHGFGLRLTEAVAEAARRDGIELLGASFGAERGLIDFWAQAGFVPARLGLGVEASSGEHTLMMVRGVSTSGQRLRARLGQSFASLLPLLLAFELCTVEATLAARLLTFISSQPLTADEYGSLERYLHGSAPLTPYRALLQRYLVVHTKALTEESTAVLVGVLFQGRSLSWAATRLGLNGRAQTEQALRTRLASLAE
ncbi:tRNA(Met) cytidine acetyltransferase TmcA [Phytohalomonas tamaricis]|uniref:tRNA(Met) cytidine acetyltransferase TmcA n=1 Tax=Phytohalomonas tamaricis TaxID=2081032 RepID=UPI00131A24C2|nr:GNAT family N-acetyltransferase [Phytohalomonas tamaricis]